MTDQAFTHFIAFERSTAHFAKAESHLATGPLWQRSRDVAKAIGCSDLQLRRAIAKERKKGRDPFATTKWISLLIARKDRLPQINHLQEAA